MFSLLKEFLLLGPLHLQGVDESTATVQGVSGHQHKSGLKHIIIVNEADRYLEENASKDEELDGDGGQTSVQRLHWSSTSCSSWRVDSALLLPTQVTWPDIRMSQSAL